MSNKAFISTDQMRQAISDTLNTDLAALNERWTRIAEEAVDTAYRIIVAAMKKNGYTLAQIEDWERGPEFNRDIGRYWSFVNGAGLHNYDDKFIARMNRAPELEGMVIDGVDPGGTGTGDVRSGELVNDTDTITMDSSW